MTATNYIFGELRLPPSELVEMIETVKYKAGWRFEYLGRDRLDITIFCEDSTGAYQSRRRFGNPYSYELDAFGDSATRIVPYLDDRPFYVTHNVEIPPADVFVGDVAAMRRWLIDQIIKIETHEACEFFSLPGKQPGTYYKPFFPDHSDQVYAVVDKTKVDLDDRD